DKHPVSGPVTVTAAGIDGDAQADRRVHGGVDKAVHCYARAHYPAWRLELADCALLEQPGAFGENLSIDGIDETSVCIGDRWRIGSALFTVTQGRQPCYKLNLRFGVGDMAARVQDSLRAGWYLRVETPGIIAAGDMIELVARPHAQHSIAALLALIRDRDTDAQRIAAVLALPLTPSWRRLFERRAQTQGVEDWSGRLEGG